MSFDWHAIASRIRGLINAQDDAAVARVAARLDVTERSLRLSMDGEAPLPTPDVLAALVRTYGLDPSWVLTGDYDKSTHRVALQSNTEEIAIAVNRLMADGMDGPAAEQPRLTS